MQNLNYPGTELDVFAHATNWKNYWGSKISPHLKGDVLEIGAGLGVNTAHLSGSGCASWTCVEPDPSLFARLVQSPPAASGAIRCVEGTIADVAGQFDSILYVDVLEHIKEDTAELELAASRLRSSGRLIVLSPAFQSLYSAFDRQIGHHRRYTKKSLLAVAPRSLTPLVARYLDAPGALLSLANRAILKDSHPNLRQIKCWDSFIIPCARVVDVVLGNVFGRSVYAIWERSDG